MVLILSIPVITAVICYLLAILFLLLPGLLFGEGGLLVGVLP